MLASAPDSPLLPPFMELLEHFEQSAPFLTSRYIAHMRTVSAIPALLGHFVALLHNHNNISSDSSGAGAHIEREALGFLRSMIGYPASTVSGHFTSGGTLSNCEALVRARHRMGRWLALGAALRSRQRADLSMFSAAHMGWDAFDALAPALPAPRDLSAWNFAETNPWEAGERLASAYGNPFLGPVILVPQNTHYSIQKGISIMGLGTSSLWPIDLDREGRTDVAHLDSQIARAREAQRPVLMVVSVAGTTELGTIDCVDSVRVLLDSWRERAGVHIWHHVDAAYGGYFATVADGDPALSENATLALRAMAEADSVALDPHKLGYVPYSAGVFLTRTERDYGIKTFDAPYIHYPTKDDRGPFTIEGSRNATGAAATWLCARVIGTSPDGYGKILAATIAAKSNLARELLRADPRIRLCPGADSNVLCFAVAANGEPVTATNRRAEAVYARFSPERNAEFYVSRTSFAWSAYRLYLDTFTSSWDAQVDAEHLSLIRICLLNPAFDAHVAARWIGTLTELLHTLP